MGGKREILLLMRPDYILGCGSGNCIIPVGAKTSKRYSFLKSLLNLFKRFLNFHLCGPHKRTVLDF